jgi:hypothetical protein
MAKRIRYFLEDKAPFLFHAEGLTIQAVTRKNEIPVTVEIESLSRKRLLEFQAAIQKELARREQSWNKHRENLQHVQEAAVPLNPEVHDEQDRVALAKEGHDEDRPAA